ncbi:MAG: DUF4089 domain-containing protein [Nodosilinea sp.]
MAPPTPPADAFDSTTYVEAMAAALGLALPESLKPGVIANFEHIRAVAQPVVDFSLPDSVESAATFQP